MMDSKRVLKFFLSWAITIAIFIIIFSRIEFGKVIKTLQQIDIKLLFLSCLFSLFANIFFSPNRYKKILEILGCKLSLFESILLKLGSVPIVRVLPMRTGELTRVAYLKKRYGLSYFKGTSSVLLGYALSFLALFLFMLIGLFFYNLRLFSNVCFILLFSASLLFLGRSVITRLLKKGLKFFFRDYENHLVFSGEYSLKTIMMLFFYSLALETCLLVNTFFLFRAFSIEIPGSVFLLFAPLTMLISALPITVWGLGTREATILLFFSGYAIPEKLLGSSLSIFFVNGLLPVLLGLFFVRPFLSRLFVPQGGNRQDGKSRENRSVKLCARKSS